MAYIGCPSELTQASSWRLPTLSRLGDLMTRFLSGTPDAPIHVFSISGGDIVGPIGGERLHAADAGRAHHLATGRVIALRRDAESFVASLLAEGERAGWVAFWQVLPTVLRMLGLEEADTARLTRLSPAARAALVWKAEGELVAELGRLLGSRLLVIEASDTPAEAAERIAAFTGRHVAPTLLASRPSRRLSVAERADIAGALGEDFPQYRRPAQVVNWPMSPARAAAQLPATAVAMPAR